MDNFVRIQSVESGTFDSAQNRVTFVIPGNSGVVSLKDSFMELVARVDYSGAQTQPQPCFLGWSIDNGATSGYEYFPNISIVRNAEIRTARQGQVDSLRRCDVLRTNQMAYRKGCFALESDDYLSASSIIHPAEQNQFGVFFQGNKVGPVASRMVEAPLPIALPDMLPFCEIDAIDTSKTGDIRIHCELNLGGAGRAGPVAVNLITPIKDVPDSDNLMIDIPAVAVETPFTSLTTDSPVGNIGDSPYEINQRFKFKTGTPVGGAPAIIDEEFVISAITQQGTGELILTMNPPRPNLTVGQGYEAMEILQIGGKNALQDIAPAPPAGKAFTSVQTQAKYHNLNESPFYVGQRLVFTDRSTAVGGAPDLTDEEVTIGRIDQNDDGTLTLTFATARADLTNGQGYTGMRVDQVSSTNPTVTFPECRLVYKTIAPMANIPQMYEYDRFETIEDHGSGIVRYQRGIEIDGNASEALIVPIDAANQLLATNSEWEEWRLRVNNIEMTDRRVLVGSPLYLDRLVTTLLEMGVNVRSIQANTGKVSDPWPDTWRDEALDLVMAASPLPQVVGPRKNLQLVINCEDGGAGVRSYAVFARRSVILDLRK
jgi:hypothetical protein